MTKIVENLKFLQEKIASAAEKSFREARDIELIGVTKHVPCESILQAWEGGVRFFGESRIQEAESKIAKLPAALSWHMVGHLQTNKVRDALSLFKMIQSVDSLKLAEKLSNVAKGLQKEIEVLLEINIGREPSKFGFLEEEIAAAWERIRSLPGLVVKGLMTVAPYTEDPEAARSYFRRMKALFDGFPGMEILSMGMSHDYVIAIEEGATMVRIGEAIFGARK